jgi:hypothetical protein
MERILSMIIILKEILYFKAKSFLNNSLLDSSPRKSLFIPPSKWILSSKIIRRLLIDLIPSKRLGLLDLILSFSIKLSSKSTNYQVEWKKSIQIIIIITIITIIIITNTINKMMIIIKRVILLKNIKIFKNK